MKKLGLGCMRLPLLDESDRKGFDLEQIINMVDSFLAQGFTYFDTAYMYHDYQSESIVKQVLVDRYPREKFLLATKLPTMFLEKEEDMERIFNEQLQKTGAGYFDYYLMHSLDPKLYSVLEKFGGFEFGLRKKAEGKIKKLGFSFHGTADLLEKILTDHPEAEFVQLQINYLDWENEQVQSKKCYETALKHGKEIIVMEPVKGGTLAKVPSQAEKLFMDQNADMTVPSWAIRFAASLENVIMVLSGMSTMEQLLDNTRYMKDFTPLTEAEKEVCLRVTDMIKSSKTIPCTACRYCVEGCPAGILIPDYFTAYNNSVKPEGTGFENAKMQYKEISDKSGKIADCLACRQCEGLCPQHIEIVDSLKKVHKAFEIR